MIIFDASLKGRPETVETLNSRFQLDSRNNGTEIIDRVVGFSLDQKETVSGLNGIEWCGEHYTSLVTLSSGRSIEFPEESFILCEADRLYWKRVSLLTPLDHVYLLSRSHRESVSGILRKYRYVECYKLRCTSDGIVLDSGAIIHKD